MKKHFFIFMGIIMIMLCVGCSSNANNSPDNVALEMANILSKGDYKNVSKLFDSDEVYIEGKAFEEYLNTNDLNIKGNKKIELVKEDTSNDETSNTLKIKIDNNIIFSIDTIKKDYGCYVDLGDYCYDDDLTIVVPKDSTVKLNGNKLSFDKYGETKEEERSVSYGNTYKYNVEMDTYKVPKILKGKYDLTIEGTNIETINEQITSRRSDYNSNDKGTIFIKNNNAYILLPKANKTFKEEVDKLIKEYYNAVFNNINNDKDYSELKSYFDSSNEDTIKRLETEYNKLLSSKSKKKSYSEETNSEFSLDKIAYYDDYGVYYYSNDHIIVLLSCTMKYRHVFNYIDFMASMNDSFHEDEYQTETKKIVLNMKKQDNKYLIEDGTAFVPSL